MLLAMHFHWCCRPGLDAAIVTRLQLLQPGWLPMVGPCTRTRVRCSHSCSEWLQPAALSAGLASRRPPTTSTTSTRRRLSHATCRRCSRHKTLARTLPVAPPGSHLHLLLAWMPASAGQPHGLGEGWSGACAAPHGSGPPRAGHAGRLRLLHHRITASRSLLPRHLFEGGVWWLPSHASSKNSCATRVTRAGV